MADKVATPDEIRAIIPTIGAMLIVDVPDLLEALMEVIAELKEQIEKMI